MDELLDETPEQQRHAIEKEFWRRNDFRLGFASQYKPLLESLLRNVRARADDKGLNAWEFEQDLQEAEEIVEGIADALRAFWDDAPDDKFWYGFHDGQLIERPSEWTDASPIDPARLDAATARYLERPWLQSNRLEWYLLNGFIVDEMLRLVDGIKSGTAFGTINWAYLLSGGRYFPALWWRLGLAALKFTLNWLLLPGLAAVAYFYDYIVAAKWLLGIFGVLVVLRILFLPIRFMRYRTRKRETSEYQGKLNQLIQIHQSVSASTLNPTRLRERLIEIEKEDTLVRPAVYSILDRAIARDPAVFTMSA